MMRRKKLFRANSLGGAFSYLYLTLLAAIASFPLLWIVLSSVKAKGELTGNPTAFWPQQFSLENFGIVLGQLKFTANIANSVLVAGSTTLIAIVISSLGAYGVIRFFPRVGKVITRVLITTYMFPPILLAVPYAIIMGKIGLMNSRAGLVLVYLSLTVPYAMWLLVGFFKTVPLEIEEAAMIDGCSPIQTYFNVVFPMLRPTAVTVAILNAMWIWNDYLLPSLILPQEKGTIPMVIQNLKGGYGSIDMGAMMAMLVLAIVPIIIFYLSCQKYIIKGVAAGAVKG